MSLEQQLSYYRGENPEDMRREVFKGYVFISTPGHGYLCVASEDNGYSDALDIQRKSNFSYLGEGGVVMLEEDCDAPAFLALVTDNYPLAR